MGSAQSCIPPKTQSKTHDKLNKGETKVDNNGYIPQSTQYFTSEAY